MSSRKENKQKKISFSFLSLLFFMTLIVTSTFLFRIKNIICLVKNDLLLDAEYSSNPVLCKQVGSLINKSFFYTNFEESSLYSTTLTNDLGQVFLPEKITKQIPNTIVIYFKKEDPLYRVKFSQEETYLVNSKNYFVADTNEFELPLVILDDHYQQLIESNKINPQFNQTILLLVKTLKQAEVNYESITLSGKESVIKVKSLELIFDDSSDPLQLAYKIKSVIREIPSIKEKIPLGSSIQLIDMRFDLPVVKYQ